MTLSVIQKRAAHRVMEVARRFSDAISEKITRTPRMAVGRHFSETVSSIHHRQSRSDSGLQSLERKRISPIMANGLGPLARLGAICLVLAGCSSPHDAAAGGSTAGTSSGGGAAGEPPPEQTAGASPSAGVPNQGGDSASGAPGGTSAAGGATKPGASEGDGPPRAVDGRSVYALECHGDSKDCDLAAVPCFGVGSPAPSVAVGWACANRCTSDAECSDAPSGAEAQASCVPFASASHCMLVCQDEQRSFACPEGMACYVPSKSPIGYCLWR